MFNQLSYTGKQWLQRDVDDEKVRALKRDRPNWPERLLRQVVARDIQLDASLRNTLPDPFSVVDMEKAVKRLVKAIIHREKMMIYADYDVDGTSSASLLRRYLKDVCGLDVEVYVPHRLSEGYGPNAVALARMVDAGVTCLIMVDCGTNAVAAMQDAADKMVIIVVDHHKPDGEQPLVHALVNPHRLDVESPAITRDLCACGLVFLLLIGLNRALRDVGGYPDIDLRQFLDVVSLATVCDVMPLRGLNRVLVKYGLNVLNQKTHAGLNALRHVSGIEDDASITVYHLGYLLGPRINAAGRMDRAEPAIALLSCDDNVDDHAHVLHELNQRRQALEKAVLEEAYKDVNSNDPVILVGGEGWHPGLIGIVAGRIKERFSKPSCAISWQSGVGKGSGRSMPGFDLGSIIHKAVHQKLLRKGGGHAMAVGFEVDASQYEALKAFIISEAPSAQKSPTIVVDDVLSIAGVNTKLLEEWKVLEPFGAGNPTPRVMVPNVRLAYAARIGSQHVRTRWVDESGGVLASVAWQVADERLGQFLLDQQVNRPLCHVLGTVQWNDYSHAMQLVLEDIIIV